MVTLSVFGVNSISLKDQNFAKRDRMTVLKNLKLVNERIKMSCATSGIDMSKVKILAVSKKMGTNKILEAHIFGRLYVKLLITAIYF